MPDKTNILLLVLQALVLAVSASPSTACGDIVNHKDATFIIFNASQAYDCLKSVPFNPDVASRLIQYWNDTIQFHSTIAYLASPPPDYQQPRVDLVAGLAEIKSYIDQGLFHNQYAFEATLKLLLNAAHDDHLSMTGGILSTFTFGSPYDLVSVSLDGKQLPKVYVANELLANETAGLPWQPSAIATINEKNATEFLEDFAARQSAGKLEPHADWNMLMRSGALEAQGLLEVFYGAASLYPGESIKLVFENGTVRAPVPWQAVYLGPEYTGPLETGGDFYNFFVLGNPPASYNKTLHLSSQQSASSTSVAASEPTSDSNSRQKLWDSAYPPQPDVFQQNHASDAKTLLRGYFLRESSLAVLSIPKFSSNGNKESKTFIQTIKDFLELSKKAGLKRVIIDVQQNKGGQPLLAIETFKLFFPLKKPFTGSRRRRSPMADALGSTLTPYWETFAPNNSSLISNEWVVTSRLDVQTGQEFTSWENYFGSAASYGKDSYTKTEEYNLRNMEFTQEGGSIIIDSGGDPQPYEAKDIIILSDGLCSSACAIFMELMHHQANVSTVVVGGKPDYSPMQAPSGTRGARAYDTRLIDEDIKIAQQMDNSTQEVLPPRDLDFLISTASVNLRDQVRHNDRTNLPLQFVYEPANCRIFFTPKTWYNYTNLWIYAAEAAWQNPKRCVARSDSKADPVPDNIPPHEIHIDDNERVAPPRKHQTVDNPSNNLQAGPQALTSTNGGKCDNRGYCPEKFICEKVQVCGDKKTTYKDERCVRGCGDLVGECDLGWDCDYEDIRAFPLEEKNRKTVKMSGICKPKNALDCIGESHLKSADVDVRNVEDCLWDLDTGIHELHCFNFKNDVQRCHILNTLEGYWQPQSTRYCSMPDLAEWQKNQTCYTEDRHASYQCGKEKVVRFHFNEEQVYFANIETGELHWN
ncbi:hypothetical protein P170DRAFT_382985 [Aspergillus steynii IBT 23096]|uniref:Uncharacterized protein n=1 Tax=Aspergillus steynii IBT 23096 TaxID=1392250 RepID=A0A2I2G740_9EURO|nr:uncharacterized protein P170DRAFT_382985 [Aspergillus steynii IBT 23096]PLB48692.1 hypothetical protein P170DRAFT_382985 [Aspergillus steynii IBT 23096]